MKTLRLLIIDSDQAFVWNVTSALSDAGKIQVIGSETNGVKGLDRIREVKPDVVLMDIQLPGMDGIALLKELQLMKRPPVTIICTRFYSEFCIVNAQQNGASYILYKPIDYVHLPDLIKACYQSVRSTPARPQENTLKENARVDAAYRIRMLLFDMGMPPKFVGCMYLVESILLAHENRMLLGNLSKGLYAEMARRQNTHPCNIERSLRNVIATAYGRGSLSRWFDHRPTNKQFLMYLLNALDENPLTETV